MKNNAKIRNQTQDAIETVWEHIKRLLSMNQTLLAMLTKRKLTKDELALLKKVTKVRRRLE